MNVKFGNEVYDLELSGHRKLLHDAVNEVVSELDELSDEDYEELEEIHALISNQDVNGLVDGFFLNGDIYFEKVVCNDLLEVALKEAGYSVEKSNVSRSIYAINDRGVEVRISDHKRPAVEQNGVF